VSVKIVEKESDMRELTIREIEEVNGGFLANIGAGIAGATAGMAGYSMYGAMNGQMDLGGFAGAATAGFISGASFFNPVASVAGAAAGGAVDNWIDS
jgi:hypothetical protein